MNKILNIILTIVLTPIAIILLVLFAALGHLMLDYLGGVSAAIALMVIITTPVIYFLLESRRRYIKDCNHG